VPWCSKQASGGARDPERGLQSLSGIIAGITAPAAPRS
jgi:hypothetical protein